MSFKGFKKAFQRWKKRSKRNQGQVIPAALQTNASQPAPQTTENATGSEIGGLVFEKDLEETFPTGIHSWVAPSEPVVDICFVHGLSGNYKSTWTHPNTDTPWPTTLIEEEFPDLRARIVSYGYDAYCVRRHGVVSTNRLEDHAVNFMHAIYNDRDKHGTRESPLIVIAHSLGGLVTKLAILKSRDSPEPEERNLYKHLEGVLFMGTPHKGAWTASLAKVPLHILGIVKSTNASLLRVLQVGDSQLLEVHSAFMQLRRRLDNTAQEASDRKEIRIKCFREDLPTSKAGLSVTIVDKASATFDDDNAVGIHANHRDMVKFASTQDPGFVSVAGVLRAWTRGLRVTRKKVSGLDIFHQILELPSTQSTTDTARSIVASLDLSDDIEDLLCLTNSRDFAEKKRQLERRIKRTYNEAVQEFKKSLTYDKMFDREASVRAPEDGTCKWIYENEKYKEFRSQSCSLLWIKGHAGTGKSVLVKDVLSKRRRLMQDNPDVAVLAHFFNSRGASVERSSESLYRSLLHLILDANKSSQFLLLPVFLKKRKLGTNTTWNTVELADFLHQQALPSIQSNMEIIIDALDECSKDEVIDVVRRFEKTPKTWQSQFTLHICWSSRFYPDVTLSENLGFEIPIHDQNAKDILRYVHTNFIALAPFELSEVGTSIVLRSCGVILWTELVVHRLIQMWKQGRLVQELEAKLRQIPEKLHDYYNELFKPEQGYPTEQRGELRRLVLLHLAAGHYLGSSSLLEASAWVNREEVMRYIHSHQADNEAGHSWRRQREDAFPRRLRSVTCGLLESNDQRLVPGVRMIHESVREFFFSSDSFALLGLEAVDDLNEVAKTELGYANIALLNGYRTYFETGTEFEAGSESDLLKTYLAWRNLGVQRTGFAGDVLFSIAYVSHVLSWVKTFQQQSDGSVDRKCG